MTRRHRPASTRRVAVGALVLVAAATAIVALSYWLLPAPTPVSPAAVADEDSEGDAEEATPGAVVCPERGGLPSAPPAGLLIDCPDRFDGQRVTFVGEVIEAVFPIGEDRVVVTLNDDAYALEQGPLPQTRTPRGGNSGIAVLLPRATADQIQHLGNYDHRGALVEVTGEFDSANETLGGEPAIVARSARIVEPGAAIAHDVHPRTAVVAVLAVLAAGGTLVMARRSRS